MGMIRYILHIQKHTLHPEAPRTKMPECSPSLRTYGIVQYCKLEIFKNLFAPGWLASTGTYYFFAERSFLFTNSE
jgi:hypothetical protein